MNSRLLIDSIVRQTTVLIAQLSTAAGIRAPLAHVADEVFLSLAQEIEAQGIGRKVVADMFGLALRTHQKKVRRLSEGATTRERTLWEAVLDFTTERGSATRDELLAQFGEDLEREVVGVLTDLVGSGLLHASGRGAASIYGPTTDAERRAIFEAEEAESTAAIAWSMVRSEEGMTVEGLAGLLRIEPAAALAIVKRLEADGRVAMDGTGGAARLTASPLLIPLGAEAGWEAAVLDHFRAVAQAIVAKVRAGQIRSATNDVTGGATLSFEIREGHPYRDTVRETLARIRRELNELWGAVEAHNADDPIPRNAVERVWFYMGQYVEPADAEESDGA